MNSLPHRKLYDLEGVPFQPALPGKDWVWLHPPRFACTSALNTNQANLMPISDKSGSYDLLTIKIRELLLEFEPRHFENCRNESR
jgi:hypothetical protein